MKKLILKISITSFLCIVAFLFIWSVIPTAEECEIYNSTIRLHVIANSDSEKDQSAKLKVRDAIIEHISGYESDSKEKTLAMIASDKDAIEEIARQALEKEGISDTVSPILPPLIS